MPDPQEDQQQGKGLKGLFSNLVSKASQVAQAAQGAAAPTARPAPNSGRSDSFRATVTQPIGGPNSRPLQPPPDYRTYDEKVKESKDRQTFITSYRRNPKLIPEFQDKQFVYKIVTDERSYQKERLDLLQAEFKRLVLDPMQFPPDDPEVQRKRAELEAQIQECNDNLTGLFLLLKQITGITKKTGGTHYLGSGPL